MDESIIAAPCGQVGNHLMSIMYGNLCQNDKGKCDRYELCIETMEGILECQNSTDGRKNKNYIFSHIIT